MQQARALSVELVQALGAALKQALSEGGPENAIAVCRDTAPDLAGNLSRRTGWRIARVSLKPRNPLLGQPDAWEQKALRHFDQIAAGGDALDRLELHEMVEEPDGLYLRYVKALPVQQICLTCHGQKENLAAPIQALLQEHYPHDRATGYRLGEVRGAVTVKRRLSAAR